MNPMNDPLLESVFIDLDRDEEDRLTVYDDATGRALKPGDTVIGVPTIARGVNLIEGITPEESRFLTMNRIKRSKGDLDRNLPWWNDLSDKRRSALLNMCFNLGWPRLAGFEKMIARLKDAHGLEEVGAFAKAGLCYAAAAEEALDSRWAKQVGARADRIAAMIREG